MVRSGVLESRGHVAQETRQAVHANDCTLRCSARTVWAPRSRLHRLLFFTDKRSRSGTLRGRDQEIHYSRTQSRRDIRSGSSSPCSLKERTTIPIGVRLTALVALALTPAIAFAQGCRMQCFTQSVGLPKRRIRAAHSFKLATATRTAWPHRTVPTLGARSTGSEAPDPPVIARFDQIRPPILGGRGQHQNMKPGLLEAQNI